MKKYLLLLVLVGCIVDQDDVKENRSTFEEEREIVKDTVIQMVVECREKTETDCLLTPDGQTICQFIYDSGCYNMIRGNPEYSCVKYKIVSCDE